LGKIWGEIGGRIGEIWGAGKGKNERMEEGEKVEKMEKDRRKREREKVTGRKKGNGKD
jgi:hypothetical protein